jgi:hypothetical protein
MADHAKRAIALADKVLSFVEDGLNGIDRATAAWPAEYRAIVWETVADIAARRGREARASDVGTPSQGAR